MYVVLPQNGAIRPTYEHVQDLIAEVTSLAEVICIQTLSIVFITIFCQIRNTHSALLFYASMELYELCYVP